MAKRRIVVTGMGVVSPIGNSVSAAWDAILNGKSGVGPVTAFDASRLTTQICAPIKDFDATVAMSAKDVRRVDIFIHYAAVATKQAIENSGLTIDDRLAHRMGVAVGAGIGGLPLIGKTQLMLEAGGPRKITPFFIPGSIINMVAGYLSMQYGLRGPNISIVTACTTGTHNIGHAARMIAYGDADVMVAGGAENATTELGMGGFCSARAMTTRNDEPAKASRPWDKDRDGFILGEGAGILILEEYEHAKKRGATIHAELTGFGMSADAFHMTSPRADGSGFVATMQNALNDAGINANDIDYVNAHATSTPVGDRVEALALKNVFGANTNPFAVSSTKSMTGHLLGAAGAVEAIFSILSLRDQVAPPTINLDNPDEDYGLDFVPHEAKPMALNTVLSNSFGFGGTNASLIFSKI